MEFNKSNDVHVPIHGVQNDKHDIVTPSKVSVGVIGDCVLSKKECTIVDATINRADEEKSQFVDVTNANFVKNLNANMSFAQIVRGSNGGDEGSFKLIPSALHFVKPKVEDGHVIVRPPKEIAEEGCAFWRNTLIGYFVGKKLHFPAVNSIALRLWGKFGLREVLSSDVGFYFFRFDTYDDACKVMERAPWHMANRPLVLKHWKPNLSLTKEDCSKVPVWVRLHNVPLEYWSSNGLSFVASAIGYPLHADHVTLSRKRLSYARVCVEIDASQNLIEDFNLQCPDGLWKRIRVEYEWVPMKCSSCGVFGHTTSNCSKVEPKPEITKTSKPSQVWVPKLEVSCNAQHDSVEQVSSPRVVVVENKEEWITIQQKRKGKVAGPAKANEVTNLTDQPTSQDECSSKGKEIVVFVEHGEGECTPTVKLIHSDDNQEFGVDFDGESDSSFPSNALAIKAKDSLEKKKQGSGGKKKGSGGKKSRKHHSPRGGRWR